MAKQMANRLAILAIKPFLPAIAASKMANVIYITCFSRALMAKQMAKPAIPGRNGVSGGVVAYPGQDALTCTKNSSSRRSSHMLDPNLKTRKIL
jgi:hypothetical protein